MTFFEFELIGFLNQSKDIGQLFDVENIGGICQLFERGGQKSSIEIFGRFDRHDRTETPLGRVHRSRIRQVRHSISLLDHLK